MNCILVIGGCGYIGSHVVRQLSESGKRVVVYDNLSTGFSDALIHGEELVVGDLSDTEKLESVFRQYGCTIVFHFAAAIVAPESVAVPLKYYYNNTCNTLNLLKACIKFGVKHFVFSSTAAVYGLPDGGYAGEEDATAPINPYGTSKLMSEWMLRDTAAAHELSYVALRYFNVAGSDPKGRMGQRSPNATHLIKICCQTALGMRDSVSIFGTDYPTKDGTAIRDYIHVEDLAAAHLSALNYLEDGGGPIIVNVGYGHGKTVREVIEVAKEVSGVDFLFQEAPRRVGDPAILVAKTDRIRALFKWEPKYNDLHMILEDAWRWEKILQKY